MTRFFGKVGFVTTVRSGGVSENVATEREYYGDMKRTTRYFRQGGSILGEVSRQTRIEVMVDAYALENYEDIRYVVLAGTPWLVVETEQERPRLILTLGDKYNGPVAPPPVPEEEP